MQLQIVSWNLHEKNMHAKHAFADILSLNPDIICLQETPEFMLSEIIRNTKYKSFVELDLESGDVRSYLCILVRKDERIKIRKYHKEAHCNSTNEWLGSRLFNLEWNMCLHSQSVLIELNSNQVRIVNCHLDVTGSVDERHLTLDKIARLHISEDEKNVILCGDLNLFGCIWRNCWAGWFFGIRWSEFFKNEQDMLNDFLCATGLARAFPRKTITHYSSFFSNLDQILYRGLRVYKKERRPHMHNSDHVGLFVIFDK